ncbi:hypothetical protein Lche_1841 [Legionella cherrii]|uniref:Uncharacterized protein n=1 Tax=Legionella cherrii TaxID=28084 RepID=A0A0W0S9W3_9GAMM|nr:hypothetical protein [Legionella cherrii]KTC79821.1 hypothetical protein Lche_1841 [Legionella cherrii]
MSQEKISVVSRREQIHQQLAELLQKREKGIQWTADASGVYCKIDNKNELHNELFSKMTANDCNPDTLERVSKSHREASDKDPAKVRAFKQRLAHGEWFEMGYTSATKVKQLLKEVGEEELAEEYSKMVLEENTQIAANLTKLMNKDGIRWDAEVDRVRCSPPVKNPEKFYEARESASRDFVNNFENILKSRGITVIPKIDIKVGNYGGNGVSIEASFTKGKDLEVLKQQTEALAKKPNCVTTHFRNSLRDKYPSEKDIENVCQKILEFCQENPKVNGLDKMMMELARPGDKRAILEKLIDLADWKKSDSEFTKEIHRRRGRDPKVEDFYQKLAALNPNDKGQVTQFMQDFDSTMHKEQTSTLSNN